MTKRHKSDELSLTLERSILMPKKTFFRLPVEKQQRLLVAAHAEFSRVPFNEASVSNIIKAAGIPRGSFYQYFEDKADIFFYDLNKMRDSSKEDLKTAILRADGDLFAAMRIFFKAMAEEIINGEDAPFYKHLFLHTDYKDRRKMSPELKHSHHSEGLTFLIEHIDYSLLKFDRDQSEELEILFHQLMNNVFQGIASYYMHQDTEQALTIEQVEHRFNLVVDWLENGASARK